MKWFFIEFFYVLSLLALIHEISSIFLPKKKWDKYQELSKKLDDEEAKWKHVKKHMITYILYSGYFFWCVAGLVASLWYYFASLLLLSLLISRPRRAHWTFVLIDGAVSTGILCAIILAHYHHIDLVKKLIWN